MKSLTMVLLVAVKTCRLMGRAVDHHCQTVILLSLYLNAEFEHQLEVILELLRSLDHFRC